MDSRPQEHAITRLLHAVSAGRKSACDELISLLYGQLRALARAKLRQKKALHTLEATELVHEAYMRIAGLQSIDWRDRRHFFGAAAGAIRRILVDDARCRKAKKRGGQAAAFPLQTSIPDSEAVDYLDLDEALERLAILDERQSQIVELKYFCGMTTEQIAEILGVSARTVEGDWKMARSFLKEHLGG